VLSSVLTAQSLDQAKKLYNEGKFEEAKPAFES
jgi:soluble cytochrome b562